MSNTEGSILPTFRRVDRTSCFSSIPTLVKMSHKFPHNYISCPCTGTSVPTDSSQGFSRQLASGARDSKLDAWEDNEVEEGEEKTFDPRSLRANYSLYPLEHLLYCEDCHEIRCPRCTIEEILCWFCPSCLFEVPSSMVKSEGNRCQRNCFNCPICTAPLSVNSLETDSGGVLQGPWVLACAYCSWSSVEIGMQFDKPNNISGQLEKLKNVRVSHTSPRTMRHLDDGYAGTRRKDHVSETRKTMDPDEQFSALKSFYSSQLNDPSTNPLMSPSSEHSYSSPNALARIMSMYTGLGNYNKTAKAPPKAMQEAQGPEQGIKVFDPTEDADAIRKMQHLGWDGTTDMAQRSAQPHPVRFLDDVKPVATLLRTKRSKRCRTCRHILVKPEAKVQSTRFRIRLVALSYVPRMTLKPFQPTSTNFDALPQSRTMQVLLTLTNPLFDSVKITLATPTYTPGRFQSRITILCPQFEVGANTDVWEDALSGGESGSKDGRGKRVNGEPGEGEKQAEAGKVWEKGRNWSTVVVEITTPSLDPVPKELGSVGAMESREAMEEDEDVLEIPMFVRIEYEVDAAGDEAGTADKGKKEKRELAYWSVICVGRIV